MIDRDGVSLTLKFGGVGLVWQLRSQHRRIVNPVPDERAGQIMPVFLFSTLNRWVDSQWNAVCYDRGVDLRWTQMSVEPW